MDYKVKVIALVVEFANVLLTLYLSPAKRNNVTKLNI